MFLKDQHYMLAIAEEKNITKAAAKLGISQPALSKWISTLERNLNKKLIQRTKKSIEFTRDGEIYLQGCLECIQLENEMRKKIDNLPKDSGSTILLGGTAIRGARMYEQIKNAFQEKFPSVNLKFITDSNDNLKKRLLDGDITIALLCVSSDISGIQFFKAMDEELVIMVPKNHPLSYDRSKSSDKFDYPIINWEALKDTSILANDESVSFFETVKDILKNANIEKNVIFRSGYHMLLYQMVVSGIGAALIPDSFFNPNDNVSVYSVNPRRFLSHGIAIRNDKILSNAESHLIDLLKGNYTTAYHPHD